MAGSFVFIASASLLSRLFRRGALGGGAAFSRGGALGRGGRIIGGSRAFSGCRAVSRSGRACIRAFAGGGRQRCRVVGKRAQIGDQVGALVVLLQAGKAHGGARNVLLRRFQEEAE